MPTPLLPLVNEGTCVEVEEDVERIFKPIIAIFMSNCSAIRC